MDRAAPAPSFAHRVEYGALRTAIGALGALRWERAVGAGARMGALGYAPFRVRRRVVERQIAAAFPALDPARVDAIARGAFEHLGRIAVETALLSRIGPAEVLGLVEGVDGWDLFERLHAQGRGLIVVTGHLGNWEIGGAYVAARGLPIDVVARRMGNPLFDAYLTRTRSRLGMAVVPDQDAVRRTPRALAQGRVVAFVADQAGLTLSSSYIPFFGRPAKTPRGPAVFALRLGVPLLFGVAVRQPAGTYRITFEEIPVRDTGDREGDVDRVLEAYTRTLERWVRLVPEQYFWHHRRWKRQPADTPSELRDPT